jgi:rfaE bifunctional protein kinase chain/domain
MSREEPTIVVTPLSSDRFVGGAAIVAAHAAALGAHVDFFSVTGDDEPAKFLGEKLKDYHVNAHLFTDDSRPTTLKQRFRTSGRSLLRVSHLRQHDITSPIRQLIIDEFKKIAPQTDLVIFSDFNYGFLPQGMVDAMAEICREHHILMVADSQSSSQTGDVSRFKNTALLTPTEHEARLAVRDAQSGLVILAEKLRKQADGKNLFLTLGEEGLLIHAVGATEGSWETDRIPALNSSPKDVVGAGDSLLTGASLVLASGGSIWESAFIGSLAAACQVGRLGNIPLTAAELDIEINRLN